MNILLRFFTTFFATTFLLCASRAGIVYTPSNLTLGIGQSATIDFNSDNADDLLLNVDGGANVSFQSFGEVGTNGNVIVVNFVSLGIYNPPVNYSANVAIGGELPVIANNGYFRIFTGGTEFGKFADTRGFAAAVIKTGTVIPGGGFSLPNTYYGWLDLEVDTSSATETLKLYGWAFESTVNSSILTGAGVPAIPEPSTCALMAGAAALVLANCRRRRRQSER